MAAKFFNFERESAVSFNMTPVIDIVFQLIIFFALVFKFIEAENFPVAVPAGCEYAQSEVETESASTTVSVIKKNDAMSDFAVGPEKVTASSYDDVSNELAGLINKRLKTLPPEGRTVTLRIDKDVSYAEAQYALAAIAKSTATDIRLAAFKDNTAASQ